jgi:hypothetical protein
MVLFTENPTGSRLMPVPAVSVFNSFQALTTMMTQVSKLSAPHFHVVCTG